MAGSTRNPSYSETLYVTSLIGSPTVNTVPLEMIDAFRDYGVVYCRAAM